METKATAAEANRNRMPETAAIVDTFRAVFGPVKVRYAREGELQIGAPGPTGVPLSDWSPQPVDGKR